MFIRIFSFLIFILICHSVCNGKFVSKSNCGSRSWSVPLNNATQSSEFNVEDFRAFPDAFPWLVKLMLNDQKNTDDNLLICTGAAVSEFVAVFPAHCVSGLEKSRINIAARKSVRFSVENIIIHPDFVFRHPSHEHDVAVIKIRDRDGTGFASGEIACMPEIDEDPYEDCQVANFFPDKNDPSKVNYNFKL